MDIGGNMWQFKGSGRTSMRLMIPHYPVTFWISAIVAVTLIGIAKAGFAGGMGVLTTPLLASAVFFAVTNALKLIPYGMLGLLKVGNIATITLLAPMCYGGVKIGVYLNRYFSDKWFNRLVYTLLFLSGIQLVWGGLAAR
jgi:uncharacterized membrane protein YfcA